MVITKKSTQREWIIDEIYATISDDRIYSTIDYRHKNETFLKQYMHQPLQARLISICQKLHPNNSKSTIEKKAKAALFWEGDINTTINNVRFLGVQHRPDFIVIVGGIRIAVEVKLGNSGSAIREGLGQSLVYASCEDFDFVVYLFIDTSRDKKIKNSLRNKTDGIFIDSLWENYNIRFAIV